MARKPRIKAFLFDPDAFMGDSAVRRMTLAARGAYITLLCEAWASEEPGLIEAPDDAIRRLAGCDPEEWSSIRAQLMLAFDTESKPGTWIQKRMRQTYRAQEQYLKTRAEAGKRGAKSRWNAPSQPEQQQADEWQSHSSTNARAIAQPMAKDGDVVVIKNLGVGSVATGADSSGVGRAKKPLTDATHRDKSTAKNPYIEVEALKVDQLLREKSVGPELRRLCVQHFRIHAGEIQNAQAYYNPSRAGWDQFIRDLCAEAEVESHRQEMRR